MNASHSNHPASPSGPGKKIIVACAIVAGLALFLVLRPDSRLGPKDRDDLAEGREIAQVHCTRCHQLPSPEELPTESWPEAMDWMGNYLGFERPEEYGGFVDRSLIPPEKLITDEQAEKLRKYYVLSSPSQKELLKGYAEPSAGELSRFVPYYPKFDIPSDEFVSMVHIEARVGESYVGLGNAKRLLAFNLAEARMFDAPLSSPPIHVDRMEGGFRLSVIGDLWADRMEGKLLEFDFAGEEPRVESLITGYHRLVQSHVGDFNLDEADDLLLVGFGQGSLGRVEIVMGKVGRRGLGRGLGRRHVLSEQGGAVCAELDDLDGNGYEDVVLLTANGIQELAVFLNSGGGQYEKQVLRKDFAGFGYNQFSLADFNGDDRLDVLLVNGNNMELNSPPLKPYHGLRVLLNKGDLNFEEALFIPLHGAQKAVTGDFDRDGDLDIAAIAFYPDWSSANPATFRYFENQGDLAFKAGQLGADAWGRWATMAVGDIDRDGDADIMLGAGNTPRGIPEEYHDHYRKLWNQKPPVLVLKNTLRQAKR